MATKLAKFDFQQGFNRETTQYAEGQRWYDGNYVRFRAGRPQNIRGYATRSSITFDGSARALIAWTDTDVIKRALFGTPDKLYEHDGDQMYDITPIQSENVLTNCLALRLVQQECVVLMQHMDGPWEIMYILPQQLHSIM